MYLHHILCVVNWGALWMQWLPSRPSSQIWVWATTLGTHVSQYLTSGSHVASSALQATPRFLHCKSSHVLAGTLSPTLPVVRKSSKFIQLNFLVINLLYTWHECMIYGWVSAIFQEPLKLQPCGNNSTWNQPTAKSHKLVCSLTTSEPFYFQI